MLHLFKRCSSKGLYAALAIALMWGFVPEAGAQTRSASGIYSCVDAKGRTITSDRPIPACLDREQRELNADGGLKRRVGPSYTDQEQAEREANQRAELQEKLREREEKKRERALLIRYPNAGVHERERTQALEQVDVVLQVAYKRLDELNKERDRINAEKEFYAKDPSKIPATLRRRIDDHMKSEAVQKRFISDQEDEKRRINDRFDAEALRLKPLWGGSGR